MKLIVNIINTLYIMGKKLDLVGETYNLLTVIKEGSGYVSPSGSKKSTWICECECGNTTEVRGSALRYKNTTHKSCGCLHRKNSKKRLLKHGGSYSYLYSTWIGIKERCLNSNNNNYKRYGAKGISMYSLWVNSYESFEEYILSNLGERPEGMSLDRIDNDGNYEPGNVRWANYTVQAINKEITSRNSSGVKGVGWEKRRSKWHATITVNKKKIWLGYYLTKKEAIEARLAAEEMYHKPLVNS